MVVVKFEIPGTTISKNNSGVSTIRFSNDGNHPQYFGDPVILIYMFGELNSEQIEDLLKKQVIGRIGCDGDGHIYVVPVSYAYDGNYIYIRSFEGKKIEMMRKYPSVCFQVDDMQNMANWQSVIGWGDFEELSDVTERNKALRILIDRHLPLFSSETTHLSINWPFPPEDLSIIKGIVFRILLKEKTGRFERTEAPIAFTA